MTTLTLTLVATCPGGNHLSFALTGDVTGNEILEIDELIAPITPADRQAFVKVFVRLGKLGRNLNQTKALFQNGVPISI